MGSKFPTRKVRKELAGIGMVNSYRSDIEVNGEMEWLEYFPASLIDDVKEILGVQGQSLTDDYMRGMYNGIECALCIIEGREPQYVDNRAPQAAQKAEGGE